MVSIEELQTGDVKILARTISLIENEVGDYSNLLMQLPRSDIKITGITGPPGAGKSTLVDALIEEFIAQNKRVGILCIDPSSPFSRGALLGDRIRMSEWYNHPSVFIRSLATRGSMGGLHPKIIEITDIMKAALFDHIIVETVGVGQSEVEIAALADTTVVVMVPEGGDEIQTMKAGLMEIADIFVINKADRPGADEFIKNLRLMLTPAFRRRAEAIPLLKTIASQKQGIRELMNGIFHHQHYLHSSKKSWLLAEKAYYLIKGKRMHDIRKEALKEEIEEQQSPDFNLYRFVKNYEDKNG